MSKVAVVGSGPAAFMASDVISNAGHSVTLFEKRKSLGRKLLVAGSSGLNITNNLPVQKFASYYHPASPVWPKILKAFSPQDWIRFIEKMGFPTVEGTSGRFFIEGMKASKCLQAWTERLKSQGVKFEFEHELVGFTQERGAPTLSFKANGNGDKAFCFDAAILALGGGSWEPTEIPLRWPQMIRKQGIGFSEFAPSNVGYQVKWPEKFLQEAEGKPLKSIEARSPKGSRRGDAMVTKYGLEGTPIYFVGTKGRITIDLKPDLSAAQILEKLKKVKENLSPIRRVKKQLSLCDAAFALVFHCTPRDILENPDLRRLSQYLKEFPIELGDPQPLAEAISSSGGVHLTELDENFMLKNFPGVFMAGEMLDWDVPTGGFLIQGCVSQGFCAVHGALEYINLRRNA